MDDRKRKNSQVDDWLTYIVEPKEKKTKSCKKECSICLESSGKGFQCPNTDCNVWTCFKPCFETAMKGDFAIACLSCNTIIDRALWSFLGFSVRYQQDILNKKWGTELFQAQSVLLPKFQEKAKRETDIRDAKKMMAIDQQIMQTMQMQLKELKKKIGQKKERVDKFKEHIEVMSSKLVMDKEIPKMTIHCFKADCNGFMDEQYFCSLCTGTYCKLCQKNAHEGTECDSAILATMQEIEQTTKPCPKCRIPITKTHGCHQMWCPVSQCNTFFDWKTGKELKNLQFRHNPHYLDFLHQQRELNTGDMMQPHRIENVLPGWVSVLYAHGKYIEGLDKFWKQDGTPKKDHQCYLMRKAIDHFYHHVSRMTQMPQRNYEDEETANETSAGIHFLLKTRPSGDIYTKEEYMTDLVRIKKKKLYGVARQHILSETITAASKVLKDYIHNPDCQFSILFHASAQIAMETNKKIDELSKMYSVTPKHRFLQYYWTTAAAYTL